MPTQIIDGFSLNAARPIDSRMVTSGEISRNSMSYRYVGLKVYDTVDKKSFVWDGTAWKEDGGGDSEFKLTNTKPNYITKYTATGLTGSGIREVMVGQNRYVGINMAENVTLNVPLHIGGTVCATTFCGSICGNNITNNTISTEKLCTANLQGNYVLKSVNNVVQWASESGGGGGGGSTTTQNDTSTTSSFLSFVNSTTSTDFKTSCLTSNTFIGADLSTSQLILSNTNTNSNPAYSFIGNKSTGLYGNSAEVGVSLGGNKRIYANAATTKIAVGSDTIIDVNATCVGLNKNTTVTGTISSTGLSVTGTATVTDLCTTAGANIGTNLYVTGISTLNGAVTACGKITAKNLDVISTTAGINYISGYTQIWGTTAFNAAVSFGNHKITAIVPLATTTAAVTALESNQIYRDANGFLKVK